MNRRVIPGAVLLFAIVSTAAAQTPVVPNLGGVKRLPPKTATPPAPQPTSTPSVPTGPEPTGVYGWIAIVDPATGQAWLPLDYERNPPTVHGYPIAVNVHFIRSDGSAQTNVAVAGGEGLTPDATRGAWRYSIHFDHNAMMTGAPVSSDTPGVIRYNPAQWRFVNVTVDDYRWSVLERGSTSVLWSVPFSRRPANFDWPIAP